MRAPASGSALDGVVRAAALGIVPTSNRKNKQPKIHTKRRRALCHGCYVCHAPPRLFLLVRVRAARKKRAGTRHRSRRFPSAACVCKNKTQRQTIYVTDCPIVYRERREGNNCLVDRQQYKQGVRCVCCASKEKQVDAGLELVPAGTQSGGQDVPKGWVDVWY